MEEVRIKLKEVDYPYILLDDKYIDGRTPLKFECREHGVFYKPFSLIIANSGEVGCQECGKSRSINAKKISEDEVIKRLDNCNFKHKYIEGSFCGVRQPIKAICSMHGEFQTYLSVIENGSNGCSACSIEGRSGENHHSWKGGITPLHNHIRSNITKWKMDSFNIYDYRCCITGNCDNNIIHHLVGFTYILKETLESLRYEVKNVINDYSEKELKFIEDKCLELHYKYPLGVCLTEEIHKEFHSIYGYGENTPEQFYEFYRDKTGEEFISKYKEFKIEAS